MNKLFLLLSTAAIMLLSTDMHARIRSQRALDSTISLVAHMSEDTTKALLLHDISNAYARIDQEKGLQYGKRSLELAAKLKFARGQGMAKNAIGRNYEYGGDARTALKYYEESLAIFQSINDQFQMQIEFCNVGNMNDELGNYAKALEFDFKALAIAEKLKDSAAQSSDLKNIGIIYKEMKAYPKAIEYYRKSYAISLAMKDTEDMAGTLSTIGNVYNGWKEPGMADSAFFYMRRSLLLYRQVDEIKGIARVMSNIASAQIGAHRYDSAIFYAESALKLYEQVGTVNIGLCLANLGEAYYNVVSKDSMNQLKGVSKTEALARARTYMTRAGDLFAEQGNRNALLEAYSSLASIAAAQADYKAAYELLDKYGNLKDTMFSVESEEKIAGLETERALLIKEKQIEEDKRKSNERLFFIAITSLLAIIIAIVVRSFYKQRSLTAQKAKLADDKEVLIGEKDVLLKDKDMLIKEIHHRVKNNLQVVIFLLDLQTGSTTDAIAKRTMTEGAARVKSISLIHRFLYQNEDITGIEYKNFIRQLFAQVVAVFKKYGQDIKLNEDISETVLDIDTAVPLGLILNELMINSFKYAFPDTNGSVTISMVQRGESYELTYSDSGNGLSAGFDVDAATSMGMTIMRSLVRQIAGTFTYRIEDNVFVITFKEQLATNRK